MKCTARELVFSKLQEKKVRRSLEIAFFTAIGLALLNYGAVELLTVACLTAVVFVMLSLSVTMLEVPKVAVKTIIAAGAVLLICALWIFFQTTPLPHKLWSHPAWQIVEEIAQNVKPSISVTPADDRAAFLRIAAPIGVFILGLVVFSDDEKAQRALNVISASSGVISLLSVTQFYIEPNSLLFGNKFAYKDSLTSFFVNRNTAATFFGLMVILNLSLFMRGNTSSILKKLRGSIIRGTIVHIPDKKRLWWSLGLACSLVVCSIALLLTKSRAGVSSTFVSAIFLFSIHFFYKSARRSDMLRTSLSRYRKALTFISCVVTSVVVLAVFGGRVILRAETKGIDDGRFCVLPGIWSAAKDNFPLGSGLSSFSSVFPGYRDLNCDLYGTWDMAHNLYFEGLVTFGVAFIFGIVFIIVWLLNVFIKGLKTRRSFRFAPEVGIASLILVAVHSAFDFSLQISGFAVSWAAVLAPLVSISLQPRRKSTRRGTVR